MASYDPYDRQGDRDYGRRGYVREDSRRDDRDAGPRFLDPYSPRAPQGGELVPRRHDSDMSVEEIRREFPPPTGRDIRRARSAGGQGQYYEEEYGRTRGHDSRGHYDRERERCYDRRSHRPDDRYEDEERKAKHRMSKQEKIIAAVAGAALLAGGKELYDRREAKEHHGEVQRNPLASVAMAGVGALAGYQGAEFYSKQQAKRDEKTNYILQRGRDGQVYEYYSDEDGDSKEKKSHKNFLESALAATGLGAAVKTLTGGSDKRSERGEAVAAARRERPALGSRERGAGGAANKVQKAAMASLLAGATEAFRVSREPGGWRGEKAKRILTAAAGAATVDAAQKENHGKLGLAESVIGGLVGNRLINGSKRDIEEDKDTGRSRSRSRAASRHGGSGGGGGATGLAALATAGLGALGAKKMMDHSRSRSRGRDRDDSRGSSPDRDRPRLRERSRSVVDKARDGLARLGIGSSGDDDRRRRDHDDRGSSRGGGSRRYHDDDYDETRSRGSHDDRNRGSGGGRDRDRSRDRSRDNRSNRRGGYGSESDLGDSEDDERRHRKMRGKQWITGGLAAVATIHAVHNVYASVEKRKARQKAVSEGEMSEAEAKKLRAKAIMQDAASVGIAALGIKGAISEMKEVKEVSHECSEFKHEKQQRHEKRLARQRRRHDSVAMNDHERRVGPRTLKRPDHRDRRAYY